MILLKNQECCDRLSMTGFFLNDFNSDTVILVLVEGLAVDFFQGIINVI